MILFILERSAHPAPHATSVVLLMFSSYKFGDKTYTVGAISKKRGRHCGYNLNTPWSSMRQIFHNGQPTKVRNTFPHDALWFIEYLPCKQ